MEGLFDGAFHGCNSIRWLETNGQPGGLDDSLVVYGILSETGAEVLFVYEKYELDQVYAAAAKGAVPRFS